MRGVRAAAALVVGVTLALSAGCHDRFDEPLVLGGETVSPETLNRGATVYRKYCLGCHGEEGNGRGSQRAGMKPPPRDFTTGQFKFKSVTKKGDLPTDQDLLRTVRKGLPGTHMNPFEGISDEDARAVVQFVKTFSERWREERPGEPIEVGEDPWGQEGRRMAAIERGRKVYHDVAACWECHPSYLPRETLASQLAGKKSGDVPPLRDALGEPRVVETAWGPEVAPDFREHRFRVGRDPAALFRVIAAGVGGTPMPAWHDRLSDEDVWAVVHYVREIQRVKKAL